MVLARRTSPIPARKKTQEYSSPIWPSAACTGVVTHQGLEPRSSRFVAGCTSNRASRSQGGEESNPIKSRLWRPLHSIVSTLYGGALPRLGLLYLTWEKP